MNDHRSRWRLRYALLILSVQAAVLVPADGAAAATNIAWFDDWRGYPAPSVALILLAAILIALLVVLRQLRRSRERNRHLSRILQGSRAGAWEWNVQTGETRYDERWAEPLGYGLEELQPVSIDTWKKLAHPEDQAECHKRLRRHFAGKSDHYEMEVRMRHKAGHWVWVRDTGQVMTRTKDGKPEWMFGTHLDVTSRRSAQERRDAWLRRLTELSSNVPGVIYQFRLRPDGSSHFPFASKGLRDIYGCGPEDVVEDAGATFDVLHPNDMADVSRSIEQSAEKLETWHQTYRVFHPEFGLRWVEGNATPASQPDGSIIWHGHIRDITELQRALERVRTAASVFETSQEGIIISDIEWAFRDVNRAFERMTGYASKEIRGETPERLLPEKDRERTTAKIRLGLNDRDHWHGEVFICRKDGETFPAELSISAVRDSDGGLSHYVTLMTDITLRKAQERRLGKIANHDPLTGLGNRRLADERLQRAVNLARHSGTRFAVCMMDLDDFKPVNDRYGHDAGDHVLKTVAERLQDLVRSEDCVCRLGGDEFLIILREPQNDAVYERILESVRLPIRIDAGIVRVSSSLGVTLCDAGCNVDTEGVLRRADRAVYAAKSAGRNRFCFDTD
ncbi:sensor domain-containing protein [Wenzhouxiangella sp. EGI_FJ10305]|uniref:sensor domain-containing protein n=1 Tax=Wenzhouxiangella sp. EGI_FJ10305 TaxID=3243768 RepID=UPI0035E094BD